MKGLYISLDFTYSWPFIVLGVRKFSSIYILKMYLLTKRRRRRRGRRRRRKEEEEEEEEEKKGERRQK